jgi:steroid delta-isomerase-like uncharacterized protein
MSEVNKDIYRRILMEFFEEDKEATAYELYPVDHVNHTLKVHGPDEYKQFVAPWRPAFPDLKFTLEDQIAEGDKVMNRWTARATHTGDFMGIPATGNQLTFLGISIGRIIDGKIVEEWTLMDMYSLFQQLGVIPSPG